MNKKILLPVVLGICLCLLAACGNSNNNQDPVESGSSAPVEKTAYELSDADAVLQSGAFSEDLAEIDLDTAAVLYGVDVNALTDVKAYRSEGATAEEVAVLLFTDEEAAGQAKTAMELYLQGREESYADYLPDEVPKLENALLDQKGSTVLLLVANDMDAAKAVLN